MHFAKPISVVEMLPRTPLDSNPKLDKLRIKFLPAVHKKPVCILAIGQDEREERQRTRSNGVLTVFSALTHLLEMVLLT